jgi:RNase H-fold protein (predicted Holliday junction resolvase)
MCENWQVSTFLVIFNLNMNYFSHNMRNNINQIAQLIKQLTPNVKFKRSNPATYKLEIGENGVNMDTGHIGQRP